MKKDRNYMPYPMYPNNSGMNGMGMFQAPMMNNMNGMMQNPYDDVIQNLQGQMNMLDKRITNLEKNINKDFNNYNDSNYHVM